MVLAGRPFPRCPAAPRSLRGAGFCVEEQAVAQVTASGDDSYSPERRAALIGPDTAPLAVQAGPVIFGDPDTRFTALVDLLLETIARTRSPGA
jgi:hypothetical protein